MHVLRRQPLKHFEHERRHRSCSTSINRGLHTIELSRIVGSVNRVHDFDRRFRPRSGHTRDRLQRICALLEEGRSLPPIQLYQIDAEYYVLDGHHRIAAARRRGQRFIEAHITEFVPPADDKTGLLARSRLTFARNTGLHDLDLSDPLSYALVLEQIHRHHRHLGRRPDPDVSLISAARHWHQTVYLPLVLHLREQNGQTLFHHATEGDIYLYVCGQTDTPSVRHQCTCLRQHDLVRELSVLVQSARVLREHVRRQTHWFHRMTNQLTACLELQL